MTDDAELLQRFARGQDEAAFRELVDRHLPVIYSVALRQCGGRSAEAQDVAQRVFIELARRARELARHPALLGWLHTTTRFTAMKLRREEARRARREQAAAALLETDAVPPVDWPRLQSLLDEVMGTLKDRERAALMLRFFAGKPLREVGREMKLSESAARSCVDRALDKLQSELARRGLISTSAALGAALVDHAAAAAAPSGLAAAVARTALASAAAPGSSLLTLVLMKKIALVVGGILLATELATATVALKDRRELQTQYAAVSLPPPATAPAASRPEPRAPGAVMAAPAVTAHDAAELAHLEARIAQLKARPLGIVDAAMQPPANRGRATPHDFGSTVAAAVQAGDVDQLAKYIVFADDTPENRAAFMAHFSAAVRARYPTPEKLVVSIQMADALRDPPALIQFTDSPTDYQGTLLLTAWVQRASGRELQDYVPLTQTPEGWGIGPVALTPEMAHQLLSMIDPTTGEVRLPPTPAPHS